MAIKQNMYMNQNIWTKTKYGHKAKYGHNAKHMDLTPNMDIIKVLKKLDIKWTWAKSLNGNEHGIKINQ